MKIKVAAASLAMVGLSLTAVPAQAGICTIAPATKAEANYIHQIKHFRANHNRHRVTRDAVLQLAAQRHSDVMAAEGKTLKIRAKTRNYLLTHVTTLQAITRSGKSIHSVWVHMAKLNTFERSILLKRSARHLGVGITRAHHKVFVTVLMGGKLLGIKGC